MNNTLFIVLVAFFMIASVFAQDTFEKDTIKTSNGNLEITFIGHASLTFTFGNKVIYADPYSKLADYSKLHKADLILVTHHHGDHLDLSAIEKIKTDETKIVLTKLCSEKIPDGIVMNNGDNKTMDEIEIEAIPAYNLVHKRDNGEPFHVKGECNGYVLTFGDKKIYIAGDTENIQK